MDAKRGCTQKEVVHKHMKIMRHLDLHATVNLVDLLSRKHLKDALFSCSNNVSFFLFKQVATLLSCLVFH